MSSGIEIRQGKNGATIRIVFLYLGVRNRETLALPPTKPNLQYAERLRAEILNAIGRGTFNYKEYFPESKRAALFGHVVANNETVGDRLDLFMQRCNKAVELGNMSPSTVYFYEKIVRNKLKPEFGKILLSALNAAQIRKWVEGLGVTGKTVRNLISPLRMTLADAMNDGLIEFNPIDRIDIDRCVNLTAKKSEYEVEPFDQAEVAQILEAAGEYKALFQFAFATGLRTSELIALEWVDIKSDFVHVARAQVVGQKVKGTKTKAGTRTIELSSAAKSALLLIKGRKGRVFIDPITEASYNDDQAIRKAWRKVLTASGVRYRNPYQTRHTYASTLLSAGSNPWQVAALMGHKTVDMIFKHYGRWIDQKFTQGGEMPQISPKNNKKGL